ncbi:MAG: class I SAM-dependent methyltransferase [Actinomycetota bacterium]|nr:class I SAM-dependent methyltransferase [Actinomycetota bacterium]
MADVNPGRHYDRCFYEEAVDQQAVDSAAVIVPLVQRLVRAGSVVDVGCGTGAFLSAFVAAGTTDVLGLDGDHVPRDLLRIDPSQFRADDLRTPTPLDRTFDLAVSLEVAEHLPASTADRFVEFLAGLAPVVLLSAAIPGQGGVEHVNEQWPSYWADRFARHGFTAVDVVRAAVWTEPRVAPYYAQNTVIYVASGVELPIPRDLTRLPSPPLSLVHPAILGGIEATHELLLRADPSLRSLLRRLPSALTRAVTRRVRDRRARD